ncbi:hypothetical protein M409DRAFT_71669 [Zasmidium cellare ATCC 36951]|uniref:Fumarylacetoacetase-like C-terminal domain-containing protein n=1 Tax=Zasmidium cellare ATCC 36951 TaxID=1080233 RepID=A0A6A6BYA2_ZASCE|nr:uncharacterized protein M409DRAFT_71669 [Zasmidium cellare ATCC 36951]KAF2158386.1 hypothetical protein M409DRAFT_71669 [Zasmidium cellare ATCC 36951]
MPQGTTSGFERLIRFEDNNTQEQWGNLSEEPKGSSLKGASVELLSGSLQQGFTKTGKQGTVAKLLTPVPPTGIVPCIGVNYRHHAEEANLPIPTRPVVFTKPPDALTASYEDVHVHPEVTKQLDYEGELTVVIGKDAKNVSATNALDHVLGYTVGNDISARDYQIPASVCGGQFCYAKSFDQFAPVGPCIVSSNIIKDPQQLTYYTKVNGMIRQQTSTSDMVWSVAEIIEHLSRGTTLRAGTFIMTGTPSGVGLFMKPPQFLQDGDVVEIGIENIGVLQNRIVFD